MNLFKTLSVNSYYFDSINTVSRFLLLTNRCVKFLDLLYCLGKISIKSRLYINSSYIHFYLFSICKPITNLFCDCVTLAGTGGDLKNTVNLTTISALFLRLLGQGIVKNNALSYLTNKGSLSFITRLLAIDFTKSYLCSIYILRRRCLFYCFTVILNVDFFGGGFYRLRSSIGRSTVFNYAFSTFNAFFTRYFFLGVNAVEYVPVCVNLLLNSVSCFTVVSSFIGIDEPVLCSKTLVVRCYKNRVFSYILDPSKLGFLSSDSYCYLMCVDTIASLFMFSRLLSADLFMLFENVVLYMCLVFNLRYCVNITCFYWFLKRLAVGDFFNSKFRLIKHIVR